MSARKRIFASKRGEVASTWVSRTLELEGVLNSFRSDMKGTDRHHLRYNSGAEPRKLRFRLAEPSSRTVSAGRSGNRCARKAWRRSLKYSLLRTPVAFP